MFKPSGYFLRIKKTEGNSGKFLVTQGRFFDSKSDNPVYIFILNLHFVSKNQKFQFL